MSPDVAPALRDALVAADFTYDGVADLLGARAHDALARNETVPARAATTGGSPIETLTRLFLLQAPVDGAAAEGALPGLVDRLAATGLLARDGDDVHARLDCRPYATDDGDDDLWVVSDLTPGLDGATARPTGDHVLGISPASTSLAQLTVRRPVGRALDLGTGCGVQALHLARHSDHVVATDVNARALDVTRFNAALNDVRLDVRDGSLLEPVAGERFDLIATNPPFVISPGPGAPRQGQGPLLVYRDSGLPGDGVVEHVVRAAPGHLTDGGWCQVLANWVVERRRPWDERLAGWLGDDVDALVVQRELLDPAAYVELWLKDSGHHPATGHGDVADYRARYDAWLAWFEEQDVEAVGFGWINLRHRGEGAEGAGHHELLEWPYDVEQPIAPAVLEWGATAGRTVAGHDRLVTRADVLQETVGPVGASDPATVVLRQQRGLRRARTADTVEAALVGACDGDLEVGQILDAVAQLLDLDAAQTRATYLPVAAELVAQGFLTPAGDATPSA
ncbi:class I SAM-dependent methyltransferase [Nocardioides marinquilinus]|uniref:Class I SAM-dependent methyltransferase n=1 Tax=Nocardioides marinquilinus TaxID=1210400 RepID=A0ABP9P549_9ACTN